MPTRLAHLGCDAGLGPFGYLISIALPLLQLTAAANLFLLRKEAVPLFAASLVAHVGYAVVQIFTAHWGIVIHGPTLLAMGGMWVILTAIVVHACHLRDSRVLR